MHFEKVAIPDTLLERGPAALLHELAARAPDAAVFRFGEAVWSRRRLADRVDALAHGLRARGLAAGDRLMLHLTNRPDMIVALQACFATGVIACPVRVQWTGPEIAALIERLRPSLYVGCQDLYTTVADLPQASLPDRCRVLVDGQGPGGHWEDLFGPETTLHSTPGSGPDNAPAVIITTSGTSGEPKLVAHSLRSLCYGAVLFGNREFRPEDQILLSTALGHASGLATHFAALALGASCELMDRPHAGSILDAIERHRITVLLGMSSTYADLIAEQRDRPRDLSALRACYTGGDVTPMDLQRRCREHLGPRLQSYLGSTETLRSFAPGLSDGPLCRPYPEVETRLTDPNGLAVEKGKPGELRLRGPTLCLGYWQLGAKIDRARDSVGWFRTGDSMVEEKDGQFRFVARLKDLIVRGGTNISPLEVEQALMEHPAVRAAAVFGIPDPRLGQRVRAAVELKETTDTTDGRSIRAFAACRLADYKVPEEIAIVPALPRNALGKLDRTRLSAVSDFA